MVCSLTGCSSSGGSSSPQRGLGGEQDGVQLPGYALRAQSCSGTVQTQFTPGRRSMIEERICICLHSSVQASYNTSSYTFKNYGLSICGLREYVSYLSEHYTVVHTPTVWTT